jgi:hypothetical protein
MMEAICFSETSDSLRTTQRHNTKDRTAHIHRHKNSESSNVALIVREK